MKPLGQSAPIDGRTRRRTEAMRKVQEAALRLFRRHGYEAVTVEQIAAAAGVGPATIYRNFGSKERVILWDEYDPLLLDCIAERLPVLPPLRAVRDGLIDALSAVYREDSVRILRRARLIRTTPALLAAAAADLQALRKALAELLAPTVKDPFRCSILAAAVVVALEAAINRWVEEKGRRPLAAAMREAFKVLAALDEDA
jgi:AcrR family transcriptional regulator